MRRNNIVWVEYYVVFCKSTLEHWIFKFLDPYFQHCYAIKKSEGGQFWQIIDPKRGFTEIDLKTVDQYPTIRALCGRDATIINVRSRIENDTRCRIWHLNCVEFVKSLVGINKFWVWTPRQLYKYLIGDNHVR